MKVQPKTEQQIAASGLIPPGVYPFEIFEAEEMQSKAGNDMIRLHLTVFVNGSSRRLYDYLLQSMERKLRNVAKELGLLSQYEAGELQAEYFAGKSGYCKVGIQKDKTGEWPDRNTVLDYVADPVGNASNVAGNASKPPMKFGALKPSGDTWDNVGGIGGDEIPF